MSHCAYFESYMLLLLILLLLILLLMLMLLLRAGFGHEFLHEVNLPLTRLVPK